MIVLQDYDDHKVILSVPSNFIRTRIIEQYLDIIKSYWLIQNLKINDIQIIVSEDSAKNKIENPKVKILTHILRMKKMYLDQLAQISIADLHFPTL